MIKRGLLLAIIVLAFLLRIWGLSFPFFTSDEARVVYRGYTLSHFGEDELGRKWPIIFNSSYDYQLPLASYLTALGGLIPGPINLTARLPFILIGTLLVLTSYFVSKKVAGSSNLALINAFLISTSPALIFLSKVPNESIILSFLLTIFFLLLTLEHTRKRIFFTLAITILMVLTSKIAWFVIPPFTYAVSRFKLTFLVSAICLLTLIIFMLMPQGLRSLKENNFTLFSDVTVSNGINYLRGEGIKANQPPFLEKILFNKLQFLSIGFLHWLSYLQPNLQFTQLDQTGVNSYSGMGAWNSVLIIPFFIGFFCLTKIKKSLGLFLLGVIISIIYSGFFNLSNINYSLIILTLPFIGIIISLGFSKMRNIFVFSLMAIVLLGIVINNLDLSAEKVKALQYRPEWIRTIVLESLKYSDNEGNVLVSDNILNDAVPFFQLFGNYEFKKPDVIFPYKFTISQSKNISFLLDESKFIFCKDPKSNTFIITKRDFDKMQSLVKLNNLKDAQVLKIFTDDFGEEKAFLISDNICLK